MQGGRLSRGWALAKRSWAVLRADRSLVWYPVVSGLATLGAAVLIFGPAAAIYSSSGSSEVVIVVAAIIGAFVLTWIAVFFNTALAAAASKSLAGQDTTMDDGFAVARARIGVITQWAIVQATIGLLLTAIREALSENLLGQIFAGLLDFAWGAATFFVVPVLALEGAGPRDAFKRSVGVLKGHWGEGVVGTVSVSGVIFLIVMLPAILIGVAGGSLLSSAPAAGGLLIGVGVVVLLVGIVIGNTLQSIFRVALFEFATQDRAVGGFEPELLQGAFAPKKRRGLFGR
jgi:uncharacterized protein DUF6159